LWLSLVGLAAHARAEPPSFDCIKDTRLDERTICASPALSQLDRQMNDLYVVVRAGLDTGQQLLLRDEQRAWLKARGACRENVSCIAALYQQRIPKLRGMLARGNDAPTGGPPPQQPNESNSACDRC